MKYWEHILTKDLTFDKAREIIEKYHPYYTTRPCWDGVHFYSKQGQYCILLADGTLLIDALNNAWSKDESDWMIVTISDEAVNILYENSLLENDLLNQNGKYPVYIPELDYFYYPGKEYRFSLVCYCGETIDGLVGGDYEKDRLHCNCGLVWEVKKPYREQK